MLSLERLLHRRWEGEALVRAHPPAPLPARKAAVHERACPPGRPPSGAIELTRWAPGPLPGRFVAAPARVEVTDGWFTYDPSPDPALEEWHLNFASSVAFSTYSLALFAQDEMQVLEHPALMSVHEALRAEGVRPRTVERDGRPTPVLVRGVERRCAIDTAPDAAAGRPRGLYGNAFEQARPEAILAATRVLDPPTVSNILAIEAPDGGIGRYRGGEIEFILRTAWAGFAAAGAASGGEGAARPARVVVHSGYWGCGAYGGNRVLMILLQCVAARAAGVDRLVIHAGDDDEDACEGAARAEALLGPAGAPIDTTELVGRIAAEGYRWGTSDGN